MEGLKRKLNYDRLFVVPSHGRGGGLCVFWKDEANLQLRSYSQNHIDMEVRVVGEAVQWRFTFFYGFPAVRDRHKSWQLLDTIGGTVTGPWLCIGDFNEILQSNEQEGGNMRREFKWKASGVC